MWFESQADLVDTPHPPLDLLSTSKLPCPGVVSGEDEADVVGIGAEKGPKVAFSKAAQEFRFIHGLGPNSCTESAKLTHI